jgi:hypothetical protein
MSSPLRPPGISWRADTGSFFSKYIIIATTPASLCRAVASGQLVACTTYIMGDYPNRVKLKSTKKKAGSTVLTGFKVLGDSRGSAGISHPPNNGTAPA